VNEARLHGCHGPGAPYRLRENARLDGAARLLSRGVPLARASTEAGYRYVTSASVQITNVPDDRDIVRIVERQFCSQVSDGSLRDIGTYRRGPNVWVLVAAPFVPPAPGDEPRISRRVLELTNEARAHARRCGPVLFQAAAPLTLAPVLERAAMEHSEDMARHSYMDHTGRDGSTPSERVTRTGYKWRTVGENLASGTLTPEETVNGWIGSPHHCENLMDPRFTQMAIAYAVNTSSDGGIYWTQLFGVPR
jgi:uncharacterized protein YkwD